MTNGSFGKLWVRNRQRIALLMTTLFCATIFSSSPALAQQSPSIPQQVDWHAMDASRCVWPTDKTSSNVEAKIKALHDNGLGCYVALLWDLKESKKMGREAMELPGLEKMLPPFNSAGVSVWAVVIPRSEGGNSQPDGTDYLRWMHELAKLSLKYPALRGVNIDDYLDGKDPHFFTPAYTCRLYRAKQGINPK